MSRYFDDPMFGVRDEGHGPLTCDKCGASLSVDSGTAKSYEYFEYQGRALCVECFERELDSEFYDFLKSNAVRSTARELVIIVAMLAATVSVAIALYFAV